MKAWGVTIHTVILLMAAGRSVADVEPNRMARYSTRGAAVTTNSTDPMTAPVDVEFPPNVITLEQALGELLAPSGYRLASTMASCPSYLALLAWSLPAMHRHLVVQRLDQALEILAGPAHYVVLDPVHRLVSFELRESFTAFSTTPPTASQVPVTMPITATILPRPLSEPTATKRALPRTIGPVEEATPLHQLVDDLMDRTEVTSEQLMVSFFETNPDSFCYRNINCLRVGATLTVPSTDDLQHRSFRQAKHILHQHTLAWRVRRHSKPRVPVTPKEVNS